MLVFANYSYAPNRRHWIHPSAFSAKVRLQCTILYFVGKQRREKCRNSPSFELGSPTQHILSWNACCGASRLPKVKSNSSLPRWWKNLRIREVSLAALPASSAYPPTKLSSRGPSRAKSYIGFYLEISCSIELTEICSSCFITAALACCFVRSVIRPLLPLPVAIWQEIQ